MCHGPFKTVQLYFECAHFLKYCVFYFSSSLVCWKGIEISDMICIFFFFFTMDRFNYFLKLVCEFSFNISVKADWHIFFSGVQFNDFTSYVGGWQKHCVACLAGCMFSRFLLFSGCLLPLACPCKVQGQSLLSPSLLAVGLSLLPGVRQKSRSWIQDKAAPLGRTRVPPCTSLLCGWCPCPFCSQG